MSEPDDDRNLLNKEGESALAGLFLKYRDRLERIVSFRIDPRIRGRLDASDVLQEAYLDIASRLPVFIESTEVSFFVWIRQRTLQTLIDIHRRHFRHKRDAGRDIRFASSQPTDGTSLSIASFLVDQATSPSQAMLREEEMKWLQEALNGMNEVDREVLALRHFEQLGNSQVAEILGITPTAASNRYLRAAARLGEIMARLNNPDHRNA
ncbi:MAG: sigma-70 family RNA polymerase sigma factor [Planctomyces sp.]|nr:sigma-70 family RNA polymerase sigma factor [Planctomyces sp.]